MDGKTRRAACRVDQSFILVRIEHLDTHIDDPTRSEILAFFSLCRLVYQILERIIYNVQIGVEELPFFERSYAHLKMLGCELNFLVWRKDTFPFALGFVE